MYTHLCLVLNPITKVFEFNVHVCTEFTVFGHFSSTGYSYRIPETNNR